MSTNRNNVIGGIEDMIEKGQGNVKSGVKGSASDFAIAAKNQVTGNSGSDSNQGTGTNEAGSSTSDPGNSQKTDEERLEYLSNLYGKGNNSSTKKDSTSGNGNMTQKGTGDIKQALGLPQKDPNEGKTPEEIAKIEALRKKLHSDFYQDLLQKAKSKDEPVTEKLEREDEEKKMSELVEESKKPTAPINPQVTRQGTGERVGNTIG